ncbi:DUF1672 family protein [Sporolactobacillus sp. Y61]|uniref:DUF1672 family protein n=1 Tax=Sporolactobacillus sp. Y61 TaxID=3160863 RepID=A0AAU8IHK8_9BACL
MINSTDHPDTSQQKEEASSSPYMPVQDYIGQGYSFKNGEEEDAFAKTHKNEIVEQVDRFFKEKYQLEVTTHHLVGAKNAVVAFVESRGEPHFHTSVIVPVDLEHQQVTSDVWAYEGKVEGAIMTGLYVMAYEKEFKRLDQFVQSVAEKYPVTGMREEAVTFKDSGYSTPYYYMSAFHDAFLEAYEAYMNDHQISNESLRKLIKKVPFNPDNLGIGLTFYMGKKQVSDKQMADKIIDAFKKFKGVAPASYAIFINSNEIRKTTGMARNKVGTIVGKTDIIKKP